MGAILALVFSRYPDPLLFAAFLGVLGTVNADTWATEIGILSPTPPRLITTGQQVSPGTSGGITSLGLWASVAGALLIGTMATVLSQGWSLINGLGWMNRAVSYSLLAIMGGLAGSVFDSLLGATVQGTYYCPQCAKQTESPVHHCGQVTHPVRGWAWLNNDVVNFLSSIVGGALAVLLAWLLWR